MMFSYDVQPDMAASLEQQGNAPAALALTVMRPFVDCRHARREVASWDMQLQATKANTSLIGAARCNAAHGEVEMR